MSELIIRRAAPEDAENLLSFLNRIGGESDNLLFGKDGFKNFSVDKEASFIKSFKDSENSVMLLGEQNNEIVAVGSLAGFSRERIAHRADLSVSVEKKFWGQKIGRRMLEALIDFAKGSELEVIELQVKCDNERAVALYEDVGFEKIGIYKKFFKFGSSYADAYLMNLYLN